MQTAHAPAAPGGRARLARRVVAAALLGVLAIAAVAAALAEARGWPFLAAPAERYLSQRLQREVGLARAADGGRSRFRLQLLGTPRLEVDRLVVANAPWSRLGALLTAEQAAVEVRWRDLLAARRGAPLVVKELSARAVDVQLERLADGRVSWDLAPAAAAGTAARARIEGVRFEALRIVRGTFRVVDAPRETDLGGRFTPRDDALHGQAGWVAEAKGRWRALPAWLVLRIDSMGLQQLHSGGAAVVPLVFDAGAGSARLRFDGSVADPLGRRSLNGRYEVAGDSLADAATALRLTLPATPAFTISGTVQRAGAAWHVVASRARIGRSRLAGEFDYEQRAGAVPVLRGELRGSALWLQDLAPAVGARGGVRPRGRVLPDHTFSLPALRRMQADVKIVLDRFELGHPRLQGMRRVGARLLLADGVLAIDDFTATLAAGRLAGRLRLDGRQTPARWDLDLAGRGLRLEQWIVQPRRDGPAYVAGWLSARVQLHGRGRSTAELLAGSSGRGWVVWSRGQLSHLVVEAAGLDVAEVLGVLLRGDRALPVQCGAADLAVERGRVVPKVLVIDTGDSTLWAEGSLSLADERLDLVVRVDPKDFSPLTLRAPLHVRGPLAQPRISVDRAALARRLLPSGLLAFAHPLAALLPLVDAGSGEAAAAVAECRNVAARLAGGTL